MKTKSQGHTPVRPRTPEYVEGPEAFRRFDDTMSALFAVPKSVVDEREKEYRAQVDANPKRRGPKRKA